jgi:ATP-dependent RNA helicase HelY
VLAQDRQFFRVGPKDFDEAPSVLTRIPLPRSGSARSARYRRDVAARLVSLQVRPAKPSPHRVDPAIEREAVRLEERAAAHPCHPCPERAKHERWARRADELERRLDGLDRRIRTRTETLARQFDRVLGVLRDLGYVQEWALADKGRMLARIYGESDILVGEALASDLFDPLSPAEAAALVSTVVYESRERMPTVGELPTAQTAERYELLQRIWQRIRRTEDAHAVQLSRELDAGFATPVFHWAEGKPLEDVLAETDMAPGDFVRNCKQLVDLLRQIEEVAGDPTSGLMRMARASVLRGVVAYTGV